MNTELANITAPTLSTRLRAETRDLHAAIEQQVDVMRPDLSQDQYRALLQSFYGFYTPLESRLECVRGVDEVLPDITLRKKVALLERDLIALGMNGDGITALPQCKSLPDLSSAFQVLGCLYVTEGATLGGAIISRHVAATLKLAINSGSAFFNSYGEERGTWWKTLADSLNALPAARHDEVVWAAGETFICFTNWLDQGKRM